MKGVQAPAPAGDNTAYLHTSGNQVSQAKTGALACFRLGMVNILTQKMTLDEAEREY